ncbi:hypothetical protein IPG41_03585 [Candidatus Peregrinibacteria bacterium]|nr:MAG: hypothetical protein IPG41_03585 [Candidatus Peregrinibacteria bacterium]
MKARLTLFSIPLLILIFVGLFLLVQLFIRSQIDHASKYTFSGQYTNEEYGFGFSNIPEAWLLRENTSLALDEAQAVFSWATDITDISFDVYVSAHELASPDLIHLGTSEIYHYYYFSLEGDEAAKEVWNDIQQGVIPSFFMKDLPPQFKSFPEAEDAPFSFQYPAEWRQGGGSFYTLTEEEILAFVPSTDFSIDESRCADGVKNESFMDDMRRTWELLLCENPIDFEKNMIIVRVDQTDPTNSPFLFFYYNVGEEKEALVQFKSILNSVVFP